MMDMRVDVLLLHFLVSLAPSSCPPLSPRFLVQTTTTLVPLHFENLHRHGFPFSSSHRSLFFLDLFSLWFAFFAARCDTWIYMRSTKVLRCLYTKANLFREGFRILQEREKGPEKPAICHRCAVFCIFSRRYQNFIYFTRSRGKA